jgi:hypothetical protein
MVNLKYLKLTDDLQARVAIVMRARELEDTALLDQTKCELADELLSAMVDQSAAHAVRLARLPQRGRAVDVALTPRRRRRA